MRKPRTHPVASDSFTVLFVSLSLIMLTFFIFLNSKYQVVAEKQKQVLESVAGLFSSKETQQSSGIKPESLSPSLAGLRTELESLTVEFGGEVTILRERIVIKFQADQLFLKNDDQVLALLIPFLRRLSEKIQSTQLNIELQTMPPVALEPSSRFASTQALAQAWTSSLMRLFIDFKVPSKQISASARAASAAGSKDESGSVLIVLRSNDHEN